MTFTRRIPADRFLDLDVREGDTLHMIALRGSSFLVRVSRTENTLLPERGKPSEWLRTAKGSVRLNAGETVDDARMDYYATKYGLAK